MVNLDGGATLERESSAPPAQVDRKIRRTPPRWFVHRLKRLYRGLDCRWNYKRKMWEIGERVPWSRPAGCSEDGTTLFCLRPRWQRVIYAEELGTRVLDYVRRVRINRFVSIGDMVDKLNIDYLENSKE